MSKAKPEINHSANVGEWSELYTLFKLLGDRLLYVGDPDFNRIEELFYPIVKIIRKEAQRNLGYVLEQDLVIISDSEELIRIPVAVFQEKAVELLDSIKKKIKERKTKNLPPDEEQGGAFRIPEIEDFLREVNCKSIKAESTAKTDIRIEIYDTRLSRRTELGFSIKSQVGSDSTLFNANKGATNFVYELKHFNPSDSRIDEINSIELPKKGKLLRRVKAILDDGAVFEFKDLERLRTKSNLVLIDSKLPEILAFILYAFFSTEHGTIKDLVSYAVEKNPLGYDTTDGHNFYEYKIKRFLTDVALGMTPDKIWNGTYDATGGYLIVKEDGEILCYHVYDRNEFEEYLFANTRLESPGSTRHEYARIYKENGRCYFKLNLQVRFI